MDKPRLIKLIILGLLVTVPVAAFSILLFTYNSFAGGDDVYQYLRFSQIWLHQGWSAVNTMPWLPFNFPGTSFSDLWLLFHMYLIPFTLLGQPFGGKLATLFLDLGIFFSFAYLASRFTKNKIFILIWSSLTIFALSADFLFRILLTRAHLLNIIFVLLLIAFLKDKRTNFIFIFSILFALNNVAAILLVPILLSYIFVTIVFEKQIPFKPLLAMILGYGFGLLIHPNFLGNFSLTIQQIYGTLFFAKEIGLPVGGEIYSYTISEFIKQNSFIVILFPIALAQGIYLLWKKKITNVQLWLLILNLMFFSMSVFSKRFVEYWIPLCSISSLSFLNLNNFDKEFKQNFIHIFKTSWQLKLSLAVAIFCALFAIQNTWSKTNLSLAQAISFNEYKDASEWLKTNTAPNEIIFNVDWGSFPQLFYWNSQNRYVVGMDPMFLYYSDPIKHTDWLNIADDSRNFLPPQTLNNIFKEDFKSKYIVIDLNHNINLYNHLKSDEDYFKEVYSSEKIIIFAAQ